MPDDNLPSDADLAKMEVKAAMYKAQMDSATDRIEGQFNDLFRHLENMAAHVVAIETVLKHVVRDKNVDADAVEQEIKTRIAAGTESSGDPGPAIAIARGIISGT